MGGYDWIKMFWNERGEVGDPAPGEGDPAAEPKPAQASQPQFDEAKLQDMQDKAAKAAVAEYKKVEDEKPTPPEEPAGPEPGAVAEFLKPAIDPISKKVDQNQLIALGAADAAQFYAGNDFAVQNKGVIEAKFNELMAKGNPADRANILQWMTGINGPLRDKYTEFSTQQQVKAEQAAAFAGTAGPGAAGQRGAIASKNPMELSDDELDKQVQGVAF